MTTKIKSHRDLLVWQQSMNLVTAIYALTEKFPKSEMFGLTSQMRRCAVSIPSNIAEGKSRSTKKDYVHFLHMSLGSCAELETQIEISVRLRYGSGEHANDCLESLTGVTKMLHSLIFALGG